MKKWFLLCCLLVALISVARAQQISPKDSTWQQYVGNYKFPEGSVVTEVTVAIEDTVLTMTSSAGSSLLEKQSEDFYTIVQYQGTAKFNRDANKKIIGVSIVAMGYELEGTKEQPAVTNTLAHKYRASKSVLIAKVR